MHDQSSMLRHSIRGTINALKLGVSALDAGLTKDETVEFLEYIVQAADRMHGLLDQYDSLPVPILPQSMAASVPAGASEQ